MDQTGVMAMDHPALVAYQNATIYREWGHVFIKAGLCTRYMPMDTRRIMIDGMETTLALFNTRAEWL